MSGHFSRRDFIKAAAGGAAVIGAMKQTNAYAQGSDTIKVGLIGAGGRGQYDMGNVLKCAPGIELVAVADLVKDRLDACIENLRKKFPEQVKVTPETMFSGFDAYQKVLATDVNLVVLTTPPFFRPMHIKAAVEAGKHIFAEKPVAVDPTGVRMVIAAAEEADKKNLTIVCGTQARRMNHRIELFKRIHGGELGDLLAVECVRVGDAMRDWGVVKEKPADMNEMEYQVRRWLFHTWLSGDFITEMHVHELDIVNWGINAVPEKVLAMGGRQVRTEPIFGDVFDHFSASFEYPNGVRVLYHGAQIDQMNGKEGTERFICSKGVGITSWGGSRIEGPKPWTYEQKDNDPVLQQHADQVKAMREGGKLNEAKRVAESSLTAIIARMSAYTGRELKYNWVLNRSKLDLTPAKLEFGEAPKVEIAVPGKTPLV